MKIRAAVFDIDGTLVQTERDEPSPRVIRAIRALRAAGCKVIVATGRCLAAAKDVLGPVEADYYVTANGGHVSDAAGRVILENPMTPEEMYALVDFCEDHELPLLFAFPDGYYCYTEYERYRAAYVSSASSLRTLFDGEDQNRHLNGCPGGAGAILTPEQLDGFLHRYGHLGLRFVPYWTDCYDIMRGTTNKAAALSRLLDSIGIAWEETAAVGDGANDAEMLAHAGFAVAMGNAGEALRASASAVVPTASEDGAAVAVETYFL